MDESARRRIAKLQSLPVGKHVTLVPPRRPAMPSFSPPKFAVSEDAVDVDVLECTLDARDLDLEWNNPMNSPGELAELLVDRCARVTTALEAGGFPRVVSLSCPVTVVGDVHGNVAAVAAALDQAVPDRPTVFLGDYVDRGRYSIRTVALLTRVWLDRAGTPGPLVLLAGNHEQPEVNGNLRGYGDACLLAECLQAFGASAGPVVWTAINAMFRKLPVAAVLDGAVVCTHGGLPLTGGMPALKLSDHALHPLAREQVLWYDFAMDADLSSSRGVVPSPRGSDVKMFDKHVALGFLDASGLSCWIRAHQAIKDGCAVSANSRVLTVFSTPWDHFPAGTPTKGAVVKVHGPHEATVVRMTFKMMA